MVTQALAAEPKGQPRTLLLLLVQLVEYLLVPRAELSILLIAAAGPLGQRGCAESRRPRLRLSGVEGVLVSQRRAGSDGFARLGDLRPESVLDALRYLDAPLVRRRDAVLGGRHVP